MHNLPFYILSDLIPCIKSTSTYFSIWFLSEDITRNTLTQASKNDRKPYLFPQKKFVSVFYAINIFNTIYYFTNRQTIIVRRENVFCKFHTLFSVLFTMFLVYHELKQKIKFKMYWRMHLHTEINSNLKSIYELFKMYMKSLDSFILASRDNWVSCNQKLGCLCLYGDSRVSRAQPHINAHEILLQHDWLLFCSRHNRFAETHSYLQLSYQKTDRLLAAGNKKICFVALMTIALAINNRNPFWPPPPHPTPGIFHWPLLFPHITGSFIFTSTWMCIHI